MSKIATEILSAIADEARCDVQSITPDSRLEDLLESLDRLSLVLRLEEAYGLEISDADLERLLIDGTVGGVIAYAERRLGTSASARTGAKTEGTR